jgi:hypothetical protein
VDAQAERHPLTEDGKQDEGRQILLWAALGVLLGFLCVAAAAALGGVLLLRSHSNAQLVPAAFVTSALLFISGIAFSLGLVRENAIRKKEDGDCDRDCKDLERALRHVKDGTLRGLAQANFKQMRTFTVIAQRQARMSYHASLVAAAASLFVLVSGAAVASGLTGTPAKITAGTLTAAGAALSGFLTVTFLKTYAMASRQMSYYYGQPLVHCYLLHAEWLTSMAENRFDKHTEFLLWKEVIRASIKASCNAQNHLLSMQGADPAWRDTDLPDERPFAQSPPGAANNNQSS